MFLLSHSVVCTVGHLYLGYNEPAGHAQASLGAEVVGDHHTQTRLRETVIRRTGVDDFINHYHRTSAVDLTGLDLRKPIKYILKNHTEQI